ncbi:MULTISPECIES: hypothetical protein [unclassified Streptomyces]|uniref:hypothetical protein n=1 Tax=unclassified Streptomyces TaxID=2593676 RepID=UPI003823AD89
MKLLPRTVAAALAACAALSVPLAPQPASAAAPAPIDRSIPETDLPATQAFLDRKPADKGSTSHYYDRAHVAGEALANCTRNTLEHPRALRYQGDAFDNVGQTRAGLFARPVLARSENTGAMSHQFETALTQTDGAWNRTKSAVRNVTERIQPGDVSWIEVQPARHRVYGSFTATGSGTPAWRIGVIVDTPTPPCPTASCSASHP